MLRLSLGALDVTYTLGGQSKELSVSNSYYE